MVELVDLVTTLSSVAVGAILGALLTFAFSVRQDKRQRGNRRVEVANIINADVNSRIRALKMIKEISEYSLEETNEVQQKPHIDMFTGINYTKSVVKYITNRDVFTAYLSEIALLPPQTVELVLKLYDDRIPFTVELINESLEKKVIPDMVPIACDQAIDDANEVLLYLSGIIEKFPVEEAIEYAKELIRRSEEKSKLNRK